MTGGRSGQDSNPAPDRASAGGALPGPRHVPQLAGDDVLLEIVQRLAQCAAQDDAPQRLVQPAEARRVLAAVAVARARPDSLLLDLTQGGAFMTRGGPWPGERPVMTALWLAAAMTGRWVPLGPGGRNAMAGRFDRARAQLARVDPLLARALEPRAGKAPGFKLRGIGGWVFGLLVPDPRAPRLELRLHGQPVRDLRAHSSDPCFARVLLHALRSGEDHVRITNRGTHEHP